MASSSSSSTSAPHYRSRFGDTTLTKVFVGGLAWETKTEELYRYFAPFGEILEAVIINDKITGKSKGYGFVTFKEAEAAQRSVENPNPIIDGRRANCNIASLGRPNPSPPRGQSGNIEGQGQPMGASFQRGSSQVVPPQIMYPTYGYVPYQPEYAFSQQAMYNPQQLGQSPYYQQMFGPNTPTSQVPYHYNPYGYYVQSPRTSFSPSSRGPRPQYILYTAPNVEASSSQSNVIQLQPPPHVRQMVNPAEPPTSQQQPTSDDDDKNPDDDDKNPDS